MWILYSHYKSLFSVNDLIPHSSTSWVAFPPELDYSKVTGSDISLGLNKNCSQNSQQKFITHPPNILRDHRNSSKITFISRV